MSPEQRFIYAVLMQLHQRKCGAAAVKTREVAPRAHYSVRMVQYHLARLEDCGLVARRGSRGGWVPVMAI